MASNIVQVGHPLAQHHLTRLRDRSTSCSEFRTSLRRVSSLLACEATRDLPVCDVDIHTPLTSMTATEVRQQIALVPILRAGLGMVDPILDLIPTAEVWHLGIYRDEITAQPIEYYDKIPEARPADLAIVLDPMLATGGSATVAIQRLKNWGVRSIKLISVIASTAGIDVIATRFPATQIYVAAIDETLDSRKFIVPGLGDAGDRVFNTRHSE